MAEVWLLAGDAAVSQTSIVRALRAVEAKVTIVPLGRGVDFWDAELPDLIVFGSASVGPPHPLLVRAAAKGVPSLHVATSPVRKRPFAEVLVLPASVKDVVEQLLAILQQSEEPPVRLAS